METVTHLINQKTVITLHYHKIAITYKEMILNYELMVFKFTDTSGITYSGLSRIKF